MSKVLMVLKALWQMQRAGLAIAEHWHPLEEAVWRTTGSSAIKMAKALNITETRKSGRNVQYRLTPVGVFMSKRYSAILEDMPYKYAFSLIKKIEKNKKYLEHIPGPQSEMPGTLTERYLALKDLAPLLVKKREGVRAIVSFSERYYRITEFIRIFEENYDRIKDEKHISF